MLRRCAPTVPTCGQGANIIARDEAARILTVHVATVDRLIGDGVLGFRPSASPSASWPKRAHYSTVQPLCGTESPRFRR